MHVPMDLDVNLLGEPGTQECFIPKRCIHTWYLSIDLYIYNIIYLLTSLFNYL